MGGRGDQGDRDSAGIPCVGASLEPKGATEGPGDTVLLVPGPQRGKLSTRYKKLSLGTVRGRSGELGTGSLAVGTADVKVLRPEQAGVSEGRVG